MACITFPKYSISLNGSLHGYFKGERGLRQGDPLSPYLFNLGMEYLSRQLDMLKDDRSFKFHPRCGNLKITHLIFADDLLLFSKCDLHLVRLLYNCFKDFNVVLGLEANPGKCKKIYGGIDENLKGLVSNLLNFSEGVLPITYLGVPLILRVLQKIDELCGNFMWGKSEQVHKIPLISWDKTCLNKKFDGLDIYSASTWSMATTLRLLWNIHVNKENLWIKWIHDTYLKNNDVRHVQANNSDSWMWKQILKGSLGHGYGLVTVQVEIVQLESNFKLVLYQAEGERIQEKAKENGSCLNNL
ncbi:uncharacterized protein LOC109832519 [Asparagus officinalis]|uniref:uncharacterized protein LOC109832519 n=1 Tax=Asparagus officinalis TaxID=4686 RepID=UPI00098DEC50|nr:uncharacterized protein LOC109832519 [Asparagus officinalis]